MENLEAMKASLMAVAQAQMGDLEHVSAKELGEVVDMIKDLDEALYYCEITKAMKERSKSDETQDKIDKALMMERINNPSQGGENYYGGSNPRRYYDYSRMYYGGPMYYDGNMSGQGQNGSMHGYSNRMPSSMHDSRDGRSWNGRRGYMESQENHMPDSVKMEKLDEYMQELSTDITEMIKNASPQEKTTLRDKLTSLAKMVV